MEVLLLKLDFKKELTGTGDGPLVAKFHLRNRRLDEKKFGLSDTTSDAGRMVRQGNFKRSTWYQRSKQQHQIDLSKKYSLLEDLTQRGNVTIVANTIIYFSQYEIYDHLMRKLASAKHTGIRWNHNRLF